MRALTPPEISYRDLYRIAIAQTQSLADRAILDALEDRMVEAAVNYVDIMQHHGPHAVAPIALSEAEDALVSALYDKRIRSKEGACRTTYDALLASASHCPFCEDGEIYEIDHFLPQHGYHDIVMFPGNLVPICHPCNHIKLQKVPVSDQQSFLHPYFDRLPAQRWLFARIDRQANGPVLNYRVELDPDEHGTLAARLSYHFDTLRLSERMRKRSSKMLVELQGDVEAHLEALGPNGLRHHFHEEAEKHFNRHGNTLEAAAYRAASLDNEFCAGAYRN